MEHDIHPWRDVINVIVVFYRKKKHCQNYTSMHVEFTKDALKVSFYVQLIRISPVLSPVQI